MADWRDRRVPEFQAYLRNVLGREPTERDYAAAIMQLEQRGQGSVAVGHAFANRIAAEGGDPSRHLRHYDPVALGHRWHEVTPQAIDKWGAEYDRISNGGGPLQPGQTHFFSPAGMRSYYEKDPSLVRSSVRMTVPGYGEVLVPNWATKAVAAGDFTNVNGEWFLTPNERYGQDPASVRVASQDAEAQPGGYYGQPVPPPTAIASAPRGTSISEPVASSDGDQPKFADAASKAMRLASMFTPKQAEVPEIEFSPLRHEHKGLGQSAGGLQMAAQSTPYVTRAEGGAVDDTGITVPETYESLLAQQRQLIEGRRVAQMFPVGTEELPLPPGMERIETRRGVFHFDPMRVSAKEVVAASESHRENEVLGLGPMSKDDVAGVMRDTGEKPVSIVERDPMGNEVRGSLATPSTVEAQSDTILRTADPKNTVDVEPVEDVVAQRAMRIARADGGAVDEYRQPELRQWDPPWYRKLPHMMTDLFYGENAGPQQGADAQKLFGTENPFNVPGNLQEGATKFTRGAVHGDTGQMLEGGLQTGLNAIPAVPAARATAAGIGRAINAPVKTRPVGPWDQGFNLEADFRATRPVGYQHEINAAPRPEPRPISLDEAIARDSALIEEGQKLYRPQPVENAADADIMYDVIKGNYYGVASNPPPGPQPRYLPEEELDRIRLSIPEGDGSSLRRSQAIAKAHADLNENISSVRDAADSYVKRIDDHIGSTEKLYDDAETVRKNLNDTIFKTDRNTYMTRYAKDAERHGFPEYSDGGFEYHLDRNELEKILKDDYGANLADRKSVEDAYQRFWSDERAGQKNGTGTYHDMKRHQVDRDARQQTINDTGLDPDNPANKQAIDEAYKKILGDMKGRIESLRSELYGGGEGSASGSIADRARRIASRIKGDDVARYGTAVGAGSYIGHKTASGEWELPRLESLIPRFDSVENLNDQKVDAENQPGGFYGENRDRSAEARDRVDRAWNTKRATGGGIAISSPPIVPQDQPLSPMEMDIEDRFLKELERRKQSESQPPEERAVGGGIGATPYVGPLYGTTGGRADKLPGTARSGSHVLPADLVSHMGQGNTNAGLKRLDQMFKSGPYGMKIPQRRRRADGGGVDDEIPVMLSDGEYVVAPEVVEAIGNGDVQAGHDILDQWIMHERQNAIQTLASLPPPATD